MFSFGDHVVLATRAAIFAQEMINVFTTFALLVASASKAWLLY